METAHKCHNHSLSLKRPKRGAVDGHIIDCIFFDRSSSPVVEHVPHHPKFGGLSPAAFAVTQRKILKTSHSFSVSKESLKQVHKMAI